MEKQTIGKVGVYPYMKTDLPSKLMGGIQDTLNSTTQILKHSAHYSQALV